MQARFLRDGRYLSVTGHVKCFKIHELAFSGPKEEMGIVFIFLF